MKHQSNEREQGKWRRRRRHSAIPLQGRFLKSIATTVDRVCGGCWELFLASVGRIIRVTPIATLILLYMSTITD